MPMRLLNLGAPNSRPRPELLADRDRRRDIEAQHDPIRTLFGGHPVPGTGRSALDRSDQGGGQERF